VGRNKGRIISDETKRKMVEGRKKAREEKSKIPATPPSKPFDITKRHKIIVTGKEIFGCDYLPAIRRLLRKHFQYRFLHKIEMELLRCTTKESAIIVLDQYFVLINEKDKQC